MKRLLASILIASVLLIGAPLAGARGKAQGINPSPVCPAVPAPPDIAPALQAIAQSNLDPQVKATLVQQLISNSQTQYATQTALVKSICDAQLARAESKGKNWVDITVRVIAVGAGIAAAIFAGTNHQ